MTIFVIISYQNPSKLEYEGCEIIIKKKKIIRLKLIHPSSPLLFSTDKFYIEKIIAYKNMFTTKDTSDNIPNNKE